MRLSHTPGIIKRFRRSPGKFQQTFLTPLQNLEPFVSTILSAVEGLRGGTLIIDQVVPFDSRRLVPLLQEHGMPSPVYDHDFSVEAEGAKEAHLLLAAALGDWLDFIFVPAPSGFSVYADHDEYTTIFAHRKSNLNCVVGQLKQAGFERRDYQRTLSGRQE